MIKDVIDTFRFTTSAVNLQFAQKRQIDTSTCYKAWHSKT